MIKNKNTILAAGMISLAISLIIGRFGYETGIVSFLEGMFMGISIPLNIYYLIKWRIDKNRIANQ